MLWHGFLICCQCCMSHVASAILTTGTVPDVSGHHCIGAGLALAAGSRQHVASRDSVTSQRRHSRYTHSATAVHTQPMQGSPAKGAAPNS